MHTLSLNRHWSLFFQDDMYLLHTLFYAMGKKVALTHLLFHHDLMTFLDDFEILPDIFPSDFVFPCQPNFST